MLGLVRAKTRRKENLPVSKSKFVEMERKPSTGVTFFFCVVLVIIAFNALTIVFAPLPSLTTHSELLRYRPVNGNRTFEIADDMFWKDGQPFQIIGGDLHYFRILPEYWEDRLLRAKALGLNTIQTYVPWNLHEPKSGKLVFEGIANIEAFLKLCQRLGLLVMLRAGPYICAEWDLGGFPAWLLSMEPSVNLRSSDPVFFQLVERWWGILLPKVIPLLYKNGGPIIMVQIENEFGSYGDDKTYLHQLVALARHHLRHDVILYTTDGGARANLEKGTIRGDSVYSAVDFTTGDVPWPIFQLQKKFNDPGRSPPLTSEFYTGWLTHWGEKLAKTEADFTAINLEKILKRNGSAVLYMAHGGTNFGFYNGANTESSGAGYKADLTSYDYVRKSWPSNAIDSSIPTNDIYYLNQADSSIFQDAPISESGDVDNAKFKALRKVIARYSLSSLAPVPPNNDKTGYGPIHMEKMASLFDLLNMNDSTSAIESENPMSMESVGQMFGFLLYTTEYTAKKERSTLFIPKVHDRAQVFVVCSSDNGVEAPTYIGTVERESSNELGLPHIQCATKTSLYILVENMGRINYGQYIFDSKGILSPVYLDGEIQLGWKMIPIPFHNLNEVSDDNHFIRDTYSILTKRSVPRKTLTDVTKLPSFYVGHFSIGEGDRIRDTFISFNGWGKGIAFVNEFNLGRYWPLRGPQCSLYVPAPILRHGVNVLVLFELESANPELVVQSVDMLDLSCGPNQ